MTYCIQVWGQTFNKHISRIQRIQNKAIRIINFADFKDASTPLYHKSKILKATDHVKLQNFLHVHSSFKGSLPLPLKDDFQAITDTYSFNTRGATQSKIILPKVRTQNYGIYSIKYQSAAFWNVIMSEFPEEKLQTKSKFSCKKMITKRIIDGYATAQP